MKLRMLIVLMLIMIAPAFGAASDDISDITAISVTLVNQEPDPAPAGDIVEIRIGIKNFGGTPTGNLIVELIPSYPFEAVSGDLLSKQAGPIGGETYGDDVKIVKFNLMVDREAVEGSYELDVRYHEEGSSVYTQMELPIDVENKESAEIIHIDKSVLVPGKQSDLQFTINNVGRAPLKDLSFYWESESDSVLPVGSDNTRYIDYIGVGQSREVKYQVIADTNVDPGLYELTLHLDSDTDNMTTKAGVYVGGNTDFDVSLSDSSGSQKSFTIANIGSNPAYSVLVSVPEQQGWSVNLPGSTIIGNLNNGDYTVATFTLQSELGRGSADALNIQIAYTNTMGEREVVSKEVKVGDVTQNQIVAKMAQRFSGKKQESSWSRYRWYIIGAVVAGLVIVRVNYKKRKQLNPEFKLKNWFKK